MATIPDNDMTFIMELCSEWVSELVDIARDDDTPDDDVDAINRVVTRYNNVVSDLPGNIRGDAKTFPIVI